MRLAAAWRYQLLRTASGHCGKWLPDADGFGVIYHAECGYCAHVGAVAGVCDCCGLPVSEWNERKGNGEENGSCGC